VDHLPTATSIKVNKKIANSISAFRSKVTQKVNIAHKDPYVTSSSPELKTGSTSAVFRSGSFSGGFKSYMTAGNSTFEPSGPNSSRQIPLEKG
jgi:hypothetical protein